VLLLDDQHLENVTRQYVRYFNTARPHQGIGQRIPDGPVNDNYAGKVIAIPVLRRLPSRLPKGRVIPCYSDGWMG
jgi:transposase InsO family protein